MNELRKLMNLIESIEKGEGYKINGLSVIDIDDFVDDNDIEENLDEADDYPHMLGAQTADFPEDELQDYLGRVKNKEKEKRDKFNKPYVHGGNIEIVDAASGKVFDTEALKKLVMERPKAILKQNQKMQHSDGTSSIFYNVGLPALKGLAVDENKDKFVIVNTCPGAGQCKTFCYAMKGGYVQWKAVSMGQSRMLNFLLNDPQGFADQMKAELKKAEKKAAKDGSKVVVRWHDAGDFFSPQYLALAYNVARAFPDVDFYAYTKLANVAQGEKPDNFRQNFSGGAKRGEEKQIDFKQVKHSKVVPKDMFYDLIAKDGNKLVKDDKGRMQFANKQNLQTFKQKLAKTYDIDVRSILTYDEMMQTPMAGSAKYNVIIMPGDGDDSANRPDVLGSYLLFH